MNYLNVNEYRVKSRNPDYCSRVSNEEFDMIVDYLLASKCSPEEIPEMLACISNILLINRDIHINHFTSKYALSLLNYVVEFDSSSKLHSNGFKFMELVSIHRTEFLILSDKQSQLQKDILEKTASALLERMAFFFDKYSKFKGDQGYLLAFSELLKALSACVEQYESGFDQEFDGSYLTTIYNDLTGASGQGNSSNSLRKNILNFFVIFDFSHFLQNQEHLDQQVAFVTHIISCIEYELKGLLLESKNDDIIKLLVVMNRIVNFVDENTRLEKAKTFVDILTRPLEDTKNEDSLYLTFSKIVVENHGIALKKELHNFKITAYLNHLFLDILFKVCKLTSGSETFVLFLEMTGYLYSKDYIQSNGLHIPEGVDVNKYLLPKFVDASLLPGYSQITKNDTVKNKEPMTQEEKEREAERLFTIFERMEKNSTFEGFQNPIREWQQSGKFEHLPDSDDSE